MTAVLTRTYVDKRQWKVGAWSSEPDEVEWIDEVTSYKCLIRRVPELGHLCGYVCVPEGHNLHGCDRTTRIEMLRDDVQLHDNFGPFELFMEALSGEGNGTVPLTLALKVHGNLTWADTIDGFEGWWFGFDCGHHNDLSPGCFAISPGMYDAMANLAEAFGNRLTYRDVDYVTKECQHLAEQLLRRA